MLTTAALVFLGMIALSFIWARYIRAVSGMAPAKAALLDAALVVVGALITIENVASHWTILASAAGAFVGTYLSVRFGK